MRYSNYKFLKKTRFKNSKLNKPSIILDKRFDHFVITVPTQIFDLRKNLFESAIGVKLGGVYLENELKSILNCPQQYGYPDLYFPHVKGGLEVKRFKPHKFVEPLSPNQIITLPKLKDYGLKVAILYCQLGSKFHIPQALVKWLTVHQS